jgi:quinoprotein glucose dehydrogenase
MGIVAAACTGWGVLSASGAPARVSQRGNDQRSVWEGVYTDAQARRGKESYDYSCAMCHSPTLEGDSARDIPALAGEPFLNEWNAHSLKDLFDVVSRSMPKDAPASLRAQTYADLLAYVLWVNEFPTGDRELAADPPLLERIKIEKMPAKPEK